MHLFQVAYGIQPLLDRGIDGRSETVTVLDPAPSPNGLATAPVGQQLPAGTDIRQDLKAFDGMFRMPAARIQVVTTLAGSAAPWQASGDEVGDLEELHTVAPAATLRVVLLPFNVLDSAAHATAGMLAGLRLAVSGTGVASIGWSLGEHLFTKAQAAQMHSILRGAAAHHVTVIAGSGDNGRFSDTWFGGTPVKEVSLPASDPLVQAVGGTTPTVNPSTGAYIGETPWNGQAGFSQSRGTSGAASATCTPVPPISMAFPDLDDARRAHVAGDADQRGSSSPIVFASGGKTWIGSGTGASAPLWGDSWRWPTRTPGATSASSTPPSTASPAAPAITRRSTTLLPVATF